MLERVMDPSTAHTHPAEKSEGSHKESLPQAAPASGLGKFDTLSTTPLCFLKTVVENDLRSNFVIPKAFMDLHGSGLRGCKVADLIGSNRVLQLVEVHVAATTGAVSFRQGWEVFVTDNYLKPGDSLLFTMVAKNSFTVRVFSGVGLESVPHPVNLTSSYTTQDQVLTPESQSKSTCCKEVEDSEELAFGVEIDGSESCDHEGPGTGCGATDPGDVNHDHGPSISEILKQHGYTAERKRDKIGRALRHKRSHHVREGSFALEPGWNPTEWRSRRRPVTAEERDRVRAAALKFESQTKRPSFMVVMMPSHVYRGFWLTVPQEFSRLHMPRKRTTITVQDEFGFQWPGQWVVNSLHGGLSDGWAAFSRDHYLEEGDACVFEVLNLKIPLLLVHIFRVVEVPLLPGSRGGWDVHYRVVNNISRNKSLGIPLSEGHSLAQELPGDNTVETIGGNSQKTRRSLIEELQTMVMNDHFSKRRREDFPPRAPGFKARNEACEEDVKPDITPPEQIQSLWPPDSPVYLSPESMHVKVESRNANQSHTPTSLHASPEVKIEPFVAAEREGICCEDSLKKGSHISVYTRRRRSDAAPNIATKPTKSEKDATVWYRVISIRNRRTVKTEEEFCVEIDHTVPEHGSDYKDVERGPDGLWWVPRSHFEGDYSICRLS
ncbi:uncharacterized protein [Physcomitrium patens]|uniref:uncharacterized protein n=1 Tax=Physcomitrium patens TaxID=3218 RepID=UPI003CCDD7EC